MHLSAVRGQNVNIFRGKDKSMLRGRETNTKGRKLD